MLSIDIIIPSYRANVEHILPILNLSRPEGTTIHFYLIIDNPAVLLDEEIKKKSNEDDAIHIIINEHNIGVALTRNKGIDSSTGNWILFLDDDILVKPDLLSIYANAITDYTNEIGFIGLVTLPPSTTAFTKATIANGSAGIFEVANKKDHFAWGATANVMVKRAALHIYFINKY